MNKRMYEALHHGQPDHTPIFEYVLLSPIADQVLGHPYLDDESDREAWLAYAREHGWERAVRRHAQDKVALARLLGHDMIYLRPTPLPRDVERSAHPAPAPQPGQEPLMNGDPVESILRRNQQGEQGAATPLDADLFLVYEILQEELRRQGVEACVLAPAYAHGVWTDVALMQTMLLEPEVAARHFALATGYSLKLIEAYLAHGVELIGVGGDFAGNRPIISPVAYRQFIVPEVHKLSERIHRGGGYAVNASDGNLWSVIDDFLDGCGVDGYLEIDANAGMGLRALKERFGDRITLFGNIDCGSLLSFATQEEIRRVVIQCLQDGMPGGGHVFCASNAITSSVPLENYLAMVNAYREVFGLPAFRLRG